MDRKKIRTQRAEIVVKHNDLLRKSRFSLNPVEQKIIIFLISKVKPDDKELHEVEIGLSEFCSLIGIQANGESYQRIKDTIQKLSDKSWWIATGKDREVLFRWINEAEVNSGVGVVKLQLSKHLTPYLLELKRNFTSYELINVLALKSKHSIRLYEILRSYLYQREWVVTVSELREILQTGESYAAFKDFKKWVIAPALKEIDTFTDLDITLETIRKGRRIDTIKFGINEKSGVQVVWDLALNQRERLGDEC